MTESVTPVSFVELMALGVLDNTEGVQTFISRTPPFHPGAGSAFGGHVFAQSVWAASHTVDEGMVVHVRPFAVVIRMPQYSTGIRPETKSD